MPIDYQIDSARGIIYTTATGILTNDEVLAYKRRLFRDPAFHGDLVELADVRGIERLEVTPEGIGQFVQQDIADSPKLRGYRLAIVASEDFVFGMARMYQTRTSPHLPNVQVFRSMDDATAWLGRAS